MSVLMTMRMHGDAKRLEEVGQRDPDEVRSIVEDAARHGLISHRFYGTDEDIMVVDEWPDQDTFQQFIEADDSKIHALMESAGVTTDPEVSFWRKLEMPDEYDATATGDAVPAGVFRASFAQPDETRPFADGMGRMELVQTPAGPVGHGVYEPGWRWSEHVRPIVGTDRCEIAHMGYVVAGSMRVQMADGTEYEVTAGDVLTIAAGHDAWVLGDKACEVLDWLGAASYAKP